MRTPNELALGRLVAYAYSGGYAAHGDLALLPTNFENRLRLVIEKHLGSNRSPTTKLHFLSTLHTNDLYLTVACAQPTEAGWSRFHCAYRKYIRRVAISVSDTNDAGRELAENMLTDLFMPDRSGHSRIASFDGQQSLATWLGVVIRRRAVNQGMLKWNRFEGIDRLSDVVDQAAFSNVEAAITRSRHDLIVQDCFELAIERLSDLERLMLLLRYEDGLRVVEIARVLDVHPSGVTRQLKQICVKLHKRIISLLVVKYRLDHVSVRECVEEILENPAHSILTFLTSWYLRGGVSGELASKLGLSGPSKELETS